MELHGDLPIQILPRRHMAAYYLAGLWCPERGLTWEESERLMADYRVYNDAKAEKDSARSAVTTLLQARGAHRKGRAGGMTGLTSVANFEGAQLAELAPEAKVNNEAVTRIGLSRDTGADLRRPHEVARDVLSVYVETEAEDGPPHLWIVSWNNVGRAASHIDGYVYEPGEDLRDPFKRPMIGEESRLNPAQIEVQFAPMKAEILDLVQTCAGNLQPQPEHAV